MSQGLIDMDGRVAIVTGSAQGIGRAIAERLSLAGATVVIADLNREGAEAAASEIPNAHAFEVDVASEEAVNAMVDSTVAEHGKIDAIVNNAAIVPLVEWDDVDYEEWQRTTAIVLDSVYLCCSAVQHPMRKAGYGRIVNISSNVVHFGAPDLAPYVAAKAGVWGLTRALATELGEHGISVNAIAPGLTESEGILAGGHEPVFDKAVPGQALKRRGTPADIAPPAAFLCTEEAGWVTGQLLTVDGGHERH
ncbi:MAG: SDR family NAD(P)-dependent oxidoreductase [Solirubrobacterales bacterium]